MNGFRALLGPPLHRLAIAQAISMAGDRIHHLALIAVVTARTAASGAATEGWLFALGAALFLPGLLLTPLVGARLGGLAPARVLAVTDTLRAVLVLTLPFLLLRAPLAAAIVVLVLLFSLNAVFLPARGALPPQLVRSGELARANALLVGSAVVAALLAVAFGGFLVDAAGWDTALYLDAATYGVSALLLWSLVGSSPRPRADATPSSRGLRRTLAWVTRARAARRACVAWCLLWAVGGFLQVAGVAHVVGDGGRVAGLGLLAAAAALGGLAGAALARRLETRSMHGVPAPAGTVLALALAGLSLTEGLAAWSVSLFALGGAGAVLAAASETALQRSVPELLRPAAVGLREAAGRATFLLGSGLAWAIAREAGSAAALGGAAVLALGYAAVSLLPRVAARTGWRQRPAPAPTDSAA